MGERVLISNKEKAECFNSFFSRKGADRPEDNYDEKHRQETEEFVAEMDLQEEQDSKENREITEEEVRNEIRRLKPDKATGIDGIHANFLIYGGPT